MLKLRIENISDREDTDMSTWKEYTVADVISKVIDYRGKTPKKLGGDWSDSGYRALSAKNIKTGKIVQVDSIRYVPEDMYKAWMKEEIQREDILITSEAPFGQIFFWNSDEKIVLSQRLFAIRINEKFYPKYIYFYMTSLFFQTELDGRATGTTVVGIRQPELLKCRIFAPSYEEQRIIADILWCLEQKINSNEKINNNLEHQARTIYNAWFVELEPFNGKIPSDWIVSKLGDIASIKTNSFVPAKNSDAQLEHYSIPAYDDQKYPVFESATGVKSNKYILTSNSVMISKLNPETKRVWRPMCLSGLAVSSTEFIIFEAFNPKYRDFVFSIIDSVAFSDWMCAHTTGSTNSRQRTAPNATLEFQFVLPDEKAIMDFCAIVTPMYDAIAANICENQKLAQLRNAILPKLMSGELDVSNIKL